MYSCVCLLRRDLPCRSVLLSCVVPQRCVEMFVRALFFLLKVPAELAIHDRYFIVGSVVFYCAHLMSREFCRIMDMMYSINVISSTLLSL